MEDDWDLHAVVRGCAAPAAAVTTSQAPYANQLDCSFSASCFQDLFEPRREELHDLCLPFFPKSQIPFSNQFSTFLLLLLSVVFPFILIIIPSLGSIFTIRKYKEQHAQWMLK